jgi:ribonucleotide monophosphatase NagD (HAD superfamily)
MIGDNPINDIKGALAVGMIPFQKVHNGVIISEELKDHKKYLFKEYIDLLEVYSSLS